MLTIVDIEKRYGSTQALNGVSLFAPQGKILALLARNGAGKSTLVSIVAGLLSADHGEVWINGEARKGKQLSTKNQACIGLAGQETGLYPELTVADNLTFFAQLYGLPRPQQKQRLKEVAQLLGLSDLLNRQANQLSGGEKRRVHTGAALMHRPKLLLLDEPTVGADPHARNDILHAVKTIADEGTTVIYTSHYFPEIEALEADVAVMHKGHLLDQDSQKNLLRRHGQSSISIEFDRPLAASAKARLSSLPGKISIHNEDKLTIHPHSEFPALASVLENLKDLAGNVSSIDRQPMSLEQIFLQMTDNPKTSKGLTSDSTTSSAQQSQLISEPT